MHSNMKIWGGPTEMQRVPSLQFQRSEIHGGQQQQQKGLQMPKQNSGGIVEVDCPLLPHANKLNGTTDSLHSWYCSIGTT